MSLSDWHRSLKLGDEVWVNYDRKHDRHVWYPRQGMIAGNEPRDTCIHCNVTPPREIWDNAYTDVRFPDEEWSTQFAAADIYPTLAALMEARVVSLGKRLKRIAVDRENIRKDVLALEQQERECNAEIAALTAEMIREG